MTKKIYAVICFAMLLSPVIGRDTGYDPRDAEISRLTAEKRQKYNELEKCVKSVQGLQIAGISTIGLTTVGVSLNISQADKKKTLDKQINTTNSQIEKKKQEIEEKRLKQEQERIEQEKQARIKSVCEANDGKKFVDGKCVDKSQDTPQASQNQSLATADKTVNTDMVFDTSELCKKAASNTPGTECYQSTDQQWRIRWAVHEGDECPINNCFDQTNTKSCKWVSLSSNFVCVANTCKPGYEIYGHICTKKEPIKCDETRGMVVSASGDKCITCTHGYIANNGKCEECPFDKKPAGNKCEDYTCPPGQFKTHGDCTQCPTNNIVSNNRCVPCPDHLKATNNECVEFSCPADKYKLSGQCHACYGNMVPNADQSGCEPKQDTDILNKFSDACSSVSGTLSGTDKCILSSTDAEETRQLCNTIGDAVDLPTYTGSDDDGKTHYCRMIT